MIARPQDEQVWRFLADAERVVPCFPGAALSGVQGDRLQGQLSIRLGPITGAFTGEARVIRDQAKQRGTVLGAGRDRLSASRATAEIEYALAAEQAGAATRVDITVRTLLFGPLAQFGRSAIVDDLVRASPRRSRTISNGASRDRQVQTTAQPCLSPQDRWSAPSCGRGCGTRSPDCWESFVDDRSGASREMERHCRSS